MQDTLTTFSPNATSSLEDVDSLAHELGRLLEQHNPVLKEEGIDRQLENLRSWLKNNGNDFYTTAKVSETGDAWLSDVCDYLKLALDERQRMEDEGGPPVSREQAEKNEDLVKTIRRIEKILNRNLVLSQQ